MFISYNFYSHIWHLPVLYTPLRIYVIYIIYFSLIPRPVMSELLSRML